MADEKSYSENPVYLRAKEELDAVGPGMCLAKWTQVTLQLQSGHNHSCHHPSTHKISEQEIARNPSALHNTRFKKLKRKEKTFSKRVISNWKESADIIVYTTALRPYAIKICKKLNIRSQFRN